MFSQIKEKKNCYPINLRGELFLLSFLHDFISEVFEPVNFMFQCLIGEG